MSYKTILVHASDGVAAQWRYRLAADIARLEQARLIGIAPSGLTELLYQFGAACAVIPMSNQDLSFLTENAERELKIFHETVSSEGAVQHEAFVNDNCAAYELPIAARYCDLLIVGLANASDSAVSGKLARSILVHAPCPVLLVPSGQRSGLVPESIVVAWDGSVAASRAIRAALPLLRNARQVSAILFDPQKFSDEDDHSGKRLRAYLRSHGIAASIINGGSSADIGDALLSATNKLGADLLVMGSFGHSRLREIVLGGVTATVLEGASIPVLMSQ